MSRSFRTTSASFIVMAAFALLGGCASVRPQAKVADPVPVYLGDFGVHSGLFLPTPDGRYVEYGFGDWEYAAENHTLPHNAVKALAFSSGSAFGRKYHECKIAADEPELTRKPFTLQKVMCERTDVYDLIDRLDRRYETLLAKNGPPVVSPDTGVAFVRGEGHYSIVNNCNHLTAQSLRELGCDVSGVVVWSKFYVAGEQTESSRTNYVPLRPMQSSTASVAE